MRSFFILLLIGFLANASGGENNSSNENRVNDQVNDQRAVILIIGDSLSAGYGLEPGKGWVTLLQQRLDARHLFYRVVNASISGDTTANGLNRLPAALHTHLPSLVLIELGANDGLRGLPLATMSQNLSTMISLSQSQSAKVLLIGMRIPPNYGKRYTDAFFTLYASLASQYQLSLVPFLLEGVGARPALMQADGLHPNEMAQPTLLDNVWEKLLPMLSTN